MRFVWSDCYKLLVQQCLNLSMMARQEQTKERNKNEITGQRWAVIFLSCCVLCAVFISCRHFGGFITMASPKSADTIGPFLQFGYCAWAQSPTQTFSGPVKNPLAYASPFLPLFQKFSITTFGTLWYGVACCPPTYASHLRATRRAFLLHVDRAQTSYPISQSTASLGKFYKMCLPQIPIGVNCAHTQLQIRKPCL